MFGGDQDTDVSRTDVRLYMFSLLAESLFTAPPASQLLLLALFLQRLAKTLKKVRPLALSQGQTV